MAVGCGEQPRQLGRELALGQDLAASQGSRGLHDVELLVADEPDSARGGRRRVAGQLLERRHGVGKAEIDQHHASATRGVDTRRGVPRAHDGDAQSLGDLAVSST